MGLEENFSSLILTMKYSYYKVGGFLLGMSSGVAVSRRTPDCVLISFLQVFKEEIDKNDSVKSSSILLQPLQMLILHHIFTS